MRETNSRNSQFAIFDFQCVAKLKKARGTWAPATVGFSKTWARPTVGFSRTWARPQSVSIKPGPRPQSVFLKPGHRQELGTQDEKINRVWHTLWNSPWIYEFMDAHLHYRHDHWACDEDWTADTSANHFCCLNFVCIPNRSSQMGHFTWGRPKMAISSLCWHTIQVL